MGDQPFNIDALLAGNEIHSENLNEFESKLDFYTTLISKLEVCKEDIEKMLKDLFSKGKELSTDSRSVLLQLSIELRAAQECVEYYNLRRGILQSVVDARKRKETTK